MKPITQVAESIGIHEEHLELYGKYKAKLNPSLWEEIKHHPDGKLVLVTAMNPTPAGEGKTLTTIGLTQALNVLGTPTIAALREPSLGPCFGMKGGATGSGKAQIVPADDINLHFTGDIHAITAANNLLASMIDNHIYHGNALRLNPERIVWKRAMDMNDRSLRNIVTGLGEGNGAVREAGFLITSASEVMAVLCLSENISDLKLRLGRMVVGYNVEGEPVSASDIGAVEAMSVILKEAIKPNLVQTLEGTPVVIHGGPFANIAHGCSSVIGTRLALKLANIVVTEAGFGADLGAEKFFDIKCRQAELRPDAAVLVVTMKALKYNGGAPKSQLDQLHMQALESGLDNMKRHIENLRLFGVPVMVAVNHFADDRDEEVKRVLEECHSLGVKAEISNVWADGGAGGRKLAETLQDLLEHEESTFKPLYADQTNLLSKIEIIVRTIYRGRGVTCSPAALRSLAALEAQGYGHLPICMAKTPYSFSDQPSLLGAPEGFTVQVREISLSAGAGFVVVQTGNIVTMPGLPKTPAAERMELREDGEVTGLL